jgi:hypothetical protein
VRILNTPPCKVYVNNKALGIDNGFTEGYLVSVTLKENRPLLFTCYLETGAIFSGIPINYLKSITYNKLSVSNLPTDPENLETLQPYSCLGHQADIIQITFLKDAYCAVRIDGAEMFGFYLFTIEYGGGLAEDPEQHKMHNIIELEDGSLAALPNNKIRFIDSYFVGLNKDWPKYKRNSVYHFGPE